MSLHLKSYFCPSVQVAMQKARHELGPDAMLLHSRRAAPESRHLGEYEVVFSLPPAGEAADSKAVGRIPAGSSDSAAPLRSEEHAAALSREVADLRREMARIAAVVTQPIWGKPSPESLGSNELAECYNALLDQEVRSDIALSVVRKLDLQSQGDRQRPLPLRQQLLRELGGKLPADPTPLAKSGDRRIIALVGPSGAGKSTALAKLAASYSLVSLRPAQVLTLDTERIAAADQLRTLTAILGFGFQVLENPAELPHALEEARHKDFVFIDTPGFGPAEQAAADEMGRVFLARPDIETHLVLPATMRAADLKSAADRFEAFQPRKILFTRLDETRTYGMLINESVRQQRPISFLSAGQQIPEDLEPATSESVLGPLLEAVLGREVRPKAEAAA